MRLHTRGMATLLVLVVLMLAAAGGTAGRAGSRLHFTEAEIFLELNDTDGDLGIHGAIDGSTWTRLSVEGPGHDSLLSLVSRGAMRAQGLTQLSFESAEPPFDELDPATFLERFPEGRYRIEGHTPDGGIIESAAVLSHVLAAPPENIQVSGTAAAASCDDRPLPAVSRPVFIAWDPVTRSHPEIGRPGRVTISRYQLIVEREGVSLSVDLPPTVTRLEVPDGVTGLGRSFKFEIIARTTAGNNTAVESCFTVR